MVVRLFHILVLVFLVIVVSCVTYTLLKKYLVAAVFAAFISTILYQVLTYFFIGHLHPFLLMALIFGFCWALIISLIVGLPFLYFRKEQRKSDKARWYYGKRIQKKIYTKSRAKRISKSEAIVKMVRWNGTFLERP